MALFFISALLLAAWPLGHALDWIFSRVAAELAEAREALRSAQDEAKSESKNREHSGVIIYNLSYTSRHERQH